MDDSAFEHRRDGGEGRLTSNDTGAIYLGGGIDGGDVGMIEQVVGFCNEPRADAVPQSEQGASVTGIYLVNVRRARGVAADA